MLCPNRITKLITIEWFKFYLWFQVKLAKKLAFKNMLLSFRILMKTMKTQLLSLSKLRIHFYQSLQVKNTFLKSFKFTNFLIQISKITWLIILKKSFHKLRKKSKIKKKILKLLLYLMFLSSILWLTWAICK